MLFRSIATLLALTTDSSPEGTYTGSKTILGQSIDATVHVDTSTLDLSVSGAFSLDCPGEPYQLVENDVSLLNLADPTDCIARSLSDEGATLERVVYDGDDNTVSVTVKHGIAKLDLVLTKTSSVAEHLAKLNVKGRPVIEFLDFVARYEKVYHTIEEIAKALEVFSENWHKIHEHNADTATNYELSINEFADMSADEFKNATTSGCFNGASKTGYFRTATSCERFDSETTDLPDSVDWRDNGGVTPVKNQGQCGSCWSFSATGSMEGAWFVKTGELVSLSEQQLVGCSTDYGNAGCNGGLMDSAFEYAIDSGMCTEKDIPYTAKDDSCVECTPTVTIDHCIDVTSGNQLHLKEAVSRGPVAIAIEADARVFQFYSGGVLDSTRCGTQLDHGVLIVGYGEDAGKKFWTVKNSWGDGWGESGYLRIARTDDTKDIGICGIAAQPSLAIC